MNNDNQFNAPQGVIRFALEALEEAEASPDIEVNMGFFHEAADPTDDVKCFACLGGVAGLKRWNGMKPSRACGQAGFAREVKQAVDVVLGFEDALDEFRSGCIVNAFALLGFELHDFELYRDMPDYHKDPDAFKAAMHQLADDLEATGHWPEEE